MALSRQPEYVQGMDHLSKRVSDTFMSPASPTVIKDVSVKSDRGLALRGHYYFNFKDTAEQGICDFPTSLVVQVCANSDPCYQIRIRESHADFGTVRQPCAHRQC
jgi:hypothetical protein